MDYFLRGPGSAPDTRAANAFCKAAGRRMPVRRVSCAATFAPASAAPAVPGLRIRTETRLIRIVVCFTFHSPDECRIVTKKVECHGTVNLVEFAFERDQYLF